MAATGCNLVCKLRGCMDKGGHYDVQKKRWSQKGALCANYKGGWTRECMMMWK